MPSKYLYGSDLINYGVPNATSQQIQAASTLIDTYLHRPEGLQWNPDYAGNPCYMAALAPTMSFTLGSNISAGTNVSVNISATSFLSTFGGVGDVVILDRATPTITEACVINSISNTSITLASVANAHSTGAPIEYGMLIAEQKMLPFKRSVTRLSRTPIARLVSGLGSYRYGRRSAQQAGLYADQSILATMQTFGGPPEWLPWNPTAADWNPQTAEVWIPSGIFLAYYSDVRVWYLAGFPSSGIPAPIKMACAAIINAQLATSDMQGGIKVAKAGQMSLQRFDATVLDDDLRAMLSPYRALRLA